DASHLCITSRVGGCNLQRGVCRPPASVLLKSQRRSATSPKRPSIAALRNTSARRPGPGARDESSRTRPGRIKCRRLKSLGGGSQIPASQKKPFNFFAPTTLPSGAIVLFFSTPLDETFDSDGKKRSISNGPAPERLR